MRRIKEDDSWMNKGSMRHSEQPTDGGGNDLLRVNRQKNEDVKRCVDDWKRLNSKMKKNRCEKVKNGNVETFMKMCAGSNNDSVVYPQILGREYGDIMRKECGEFLRWPLHFTISEHGESVDDWDCNERTIKKDCDESKNCSWENDKCLGRYRISSESAEEEKNIGAPKLNDTAEPTEEEKNIRAPKINDREGASKKSRTKPSHMALGLAAAFGLFLSSHPNSMSNTSGKYLGLPFGLQQDYSLSARNAAEFAQIRESNAAEKERRMAIAKRRNAEKTSNAASKLNPYHGHGTSRPFI